MRVRTSWMKVRTSWMTVRRLSELLRSWLNVSGWFQPQIYKLGLVLYLVCRSVGPRREELGIS